MPGGLVRCVAWCGAVWGFQALVWAATGPGSFDPSFRPEIALGPGEAVRAVVRDSDGGWWLAKGNGVVRLQSEGRLDPAFVPGPGADDEVRALALAGDGRLYVGGAFAEFGGRQSPALVRLEPSGATDPTFPAPDVQGYRRSVEGLLVQPDGHVVVTGNFDRWNGQRAPSITRLDADGVVDVDFTENLRPIFGGATVTTITTTNVNGTLQAVTNVTVSYETLSRYGTMAATARRPDGRILVSGVVFAELEADGHPNGESSEGAFAAWVALPNGEVLVASTTVMSGGGREVQVRRMRSGGDWPTLWEVTLACDDRVTAVAVQEDGAILLGGSFTHLNGHRHEGLARLKADGTIDAGFVARLGIDGGSSWEQPARWDDRVWVAGIQVEPDGAIMVHGRFHHADGQPVPGFVRLHGGDRDPEPPAFGRGATDLAALEGQRTRIGFELASATDVRAGWYRDGQRLEGQNSPVLDFGSIRLGHSGTYQLRATNDAGVAESPLVRVAVDLGPTHPGSPDATFHTALVGLSESTPSARVWLAGIAPAGETFHVFGGFESYDGHPTRHVARVHADGQVDPGFVMLRDDPRAASIVYVTKWVPLSDGRHVAEVEYPFSMVPEFGRRTELIAVREDGSVDPGFVPAMRPYTATSRYGALAATAAGGLLAAGSLVESSGPPDRLNLVRLRADGSLDPEFRAQVHPTKSVHDIVVLGDGRIVVWWVGGTSDPGVEVVRLMPDGTEDASFRTVATEGWTGVNSVVLDAAGRLVVVPRRVRGAAVPPLVRILPDGSVDPLFQLALGHPWPSTLQVHTMALQSDGRMVLFVGSDEPVTEEFQNLVRIESDGAWDGSFQLSEPGPLLTLSSILVAPLVLPNDRGLVMASSDRVLIALNTHDERRLESPAWRGDRFEATLRTRPGRRYFVEAASDPVGADWIEIGDVEGDGTAQGFSHVSGDRRFYRVRITDR
ncbi:MAG: hypothetical protein KF833_15225 [Verrucomicrobiae bacterium]|nr:hypothetical protein [Verrucomicrobiae bacterium]